MNLFRLWLPAAALAVAIGAAGNAWSQSWTESQTTITTVPGVPAETIVTAPSAVVLTPPPAVVMSPPPPVVVYPPPMSNEITTETTTSEYSAPTVEKWTTTYGPLGMTRSVTREETTSYND